MEGGGSGGGRLWRVVVVEGDGCLGFGYMGTKAKEMKDNRIHSENKGEIKLYYKYYLNNRIH